MTPTHNKTTYYLDIIGQAITNTEINEDSLFVLGDDEGLNPPHTQTMRLGTKSYLTSHCITILNHHLDGIK